jgi:alcohol dehydrogenase (NADP+)
MIATRSYAAHHPQQPLAFYEFFRRAVGPKDICVDILYCGVCHSDLHRARGEWQGNHFPLVPGHEIIGRVSSVGPEVNKFRIGDIAAVGVIVDSCRSCSPCGQKMEQYCVEGPTGTYNAMARDGSGYTLGGYSDKIVTDEHFAYRVQDQLPLHAVAPLLCAGITTYSPLKYAGVKKGMKVGIAGLGGLGHMAVKFAAAFGAEVSLFSQSPSKAADATRLGAHQFILSSDANQMKKYMGYFDLILNCISAPYSYKSYLDLLRLDGKLIIVGLPPENQILDPFAMIKNRRSIMGSMIGGTAETQEMLDFCALNHIVADVEMIPIQTIDQAYDRMIKGDVRYRFVIDMATL